MPSRLRKERQRQTSCCLRCVTCSEPTLSMTGFWSRCEAIVETAEQAVPARQCSPGPAGSSVLAMTCMRCPPTRIPSGSAATASQATLRLLREGPLPTVAALTGPGCRGWAGNCLVLRLARRALRSRAANAAGQAGDRLYDRGNLAPSDTVAPAKRGSFAFGAEPVSAEAALRLGPISRLVDSSVVLETACALAQKMAAKPRPAVQGTRHLLEHLLRSGPSLSEEESARLLEIRQQSWQSPEARSARERASAPAVPNHPRRPSNNSRRNSSSQPALANLARRAPAANDMMGRSVLSLPSLA